MTFIDWIYNLLPPYWAEKDSYKDIEGKGLLQRFLSIAESEWNENSLPKIDNLTDIIQPQLTPSQLIPHISYILGSPIDILNSLPGFEFFYRNYLTIASTIHRIKGTFLSYQILFGIMGYTPTITIINDPEYSYDPVDTSVKHDIPGVNYDLSGCSACARYGLVLTAATSPPRLPLSDANQLIWLQLVENILAYLQPIDMQFSLGILIITLDDEGDLIYYNSEGSQITFEIVDGDLIVTGPNAEQYTLVDGDLILTT